MRGTNDDKTAPATPPTAADKRTFANDSNAFALDLYGQLTKTEKGNLFFSPYSISTALAMTYGGARGNTGAQMEKVLHFTLGQAHLHAVCGAFAQELNAAEKNGKARGFQLSVANRLFGQNGYHFLPAFVEATQVFYGAGLEQLDFSKKNAEASRQRINQWVEDKTQKKIKDLIPANAVDDALLVLTNAIYFKGDWASQFDKTLTKNEPFHLQAGNDVQAPTMTKTAHFKYMEEKGSFQALELPYKDNELSMLVFLPEHRDGLPQLEKTFLPDNLNRWLGNLAEQKIVVSLPKFKLTWGTVNLVPVFQALGLTDPFTNAADFSGMTQDPAGLVIGAIFHKAFVDVNEEGTEAAAATAVVMAPGSAPMQPKSFRADHPFLFLIRENTSGNILFIGRMIDPR